MKEPLIQIMNLTIESKGKLLLSNVSLNIYPGEITLLVGGSGSGKTVLMKILAGLILPGNPNFQIEGSIKIDGKNIWKKHWGLWLDQPPVGIVFQDYGLFDNYSIQQNLDFAFSHSPFYIPKQQRKSICLRLEQKLDLDPNLPIRYASGGQKRRIAIARTLVYNPEIIIYDEPTSALDPQMTRKVASLIRNTHEVFAKKSSIIVTHQYEEFLQFADRILFLDPVAKSISEVSSQELEKLSQAGKFQVPIFKPKAQKWYKKCLGYCISLLSGTTSYSLQFLKILFACFFRLLPCWKSPLWGFRFLLHYLNIVCFISAILYIGMAGLIIGFVGGYFTFEFLPYKHVTERLIKDDFLMALGYGLYRVIIPIFTAILVAARCGAAVTSDLGNRAYLQEVDAMKSLGASPSAYLQTNVIYSFLIGVPLLTMIAFFLAKFVCLAVFLFMSPEVNAILADSIFHRRLRLGNSFFLRGTGWVMGKQLTCGFGVANICYFIGMRPKSSTRDVSRDITLAIIWGTLFVLLTHLVFALLEFPDLI